VSLSTTIVLTIFNDGKNNQKETVKDEKLFLPRFENLIINFNKLQDEY